MSKRQFMAAGFLPWVILGIALTMLHPPPWPSTWTRMTPTLLLGLAIGGAVPYLALATYGALVGLFYAFLPQRLPQFNSYLKGWLVYAAAHFPLYLLRVALEYRSFAKLNVDIAVKSFLGRCLETFLECCLVGLLLGAAFAAFAWFFSRLSGNKT